MPLGYEDFASSFLVPFVDGTSRRLRAVLHPAPIIAVVCRPVFLTVEKLGPAKPYLAFIGICASCYLAGRVIYVFWRGVVSYLLAGPLHLGTNLGQLTADDGWALVTGATDGLGLAFAKELARKGVNVILVGKNAVKLDMVAREIEAQFRVKADMLVIDFRNCTVENYAQIKEKLKVLKVDILVNSVGIATGSSDSFGSQPNTEQLCLDLLHINLATMLFFIHFVLPGMKARRKGVIVNLSSVAAVYPLPNYALYGATKAFVAFFSTALDRECRPYGIFVQTLIPGPVLTSMTRNQGKSIFLVQAGPYVRRALAQIGLRRRTFGHWVHALMVTMARPIPLWLQQRLLRPRSSLPKTFQGAVTPIISQ